MAEYIDRDSVLNILIQNFRKFNFESDAMQQSIDDVREMKAADVIERKCGQWVDLRCSECGTCDMSKPFFCPCCGAYMREDE